MSKRKQLHAALDKLSAALIRQAQASKEAADAAQEIKWILEEQGVETESPTPKPKTPPSDQPQTPEESLFWKFHDLYPGTKRAPRTEFERLKTKHRDYKSVCGILTNRLQAEIQARKQRELRNDFVPEWKNMVTAINQRDWESWSQASIQKPARKKLITE